MGPEPESIARLPLSRDRVLRAAMDLADRDGIATLTMRKLAQELGVEAMTLYYYVARKADIVEGMVDLVASEIDLPSAGVDWRSATRHRAISAHDALVRHPWAPMVWVRSDVGPARIRYMDAALRTFREAGFSPEMTERAFHAIENHIVGFSLQAQDAALEGEELADAAATFLRELPAEDYPYLAEHVMQHLEKSSIDEGDFEFGVDLILDGIERVRDGA